MNVRWLLLTLLTMAVGSEMRTLSISEVDQELASIVYSARGGWLLHPLTHYICGSQERIEFEISIAREYRRLEMSYEKLGGRFKSGDDQEIMLEPYHTSCENPQSQAEERFNAAAMNLEQKLTRMRALLRRKKELVTHAADPQPSVR